LRQKPLYIGIDVGSFSTKAVLLANNTILASSLSLSGGNYNKAVQYTINKIEKKAKVSFNEVSAIGVTGCGAETVAFASYKISEISAQGKGVNFFFPTVRTVIDLGGRATTVIRIDEEGKALDFVVSEKCAAGSGRFLEILANVLRVKLEDLGPLSLKAKEAVKFTTGCAVFAESEAISRVAEGTAKESVVAGVHKALAAKIHSLVERVGVELDYAFTSGGAKDIGLVACLQEELGVPLLVPPEPQLTGAIGAALFAREKVGMNKNEPVVRER